MGKSMPAWATMGGNDDQEGRWGNHDLLALEDVAMLLNRPKSHESVIADVAALREQRYCPECGAVHVLPKRPVTPQIKGERA